MTTTTIDYSGATVRVPYVGIGVVKEQVRDFYAVDIPIGSVNMRVWRKSQDLKVIGVVVKAIPAITPHKPKFSLFDPSMLNDMDKPLETQEHAFIAEIANSHPDLIERDNASPEPRPLVVVAPTLRLFTARVVTPMLEMVA